jgi:hypothetical protein
MHIISIVHIGVVPLANHRTRSTTPEPCIAVNPYPIPSFLPPGIPIDDPLVFAIRVAQHYSDRQGQAPTMTNISAVETVTRHEKTEMP